MNQYPQKTQSTKIAFAVLIGIILIMGYFLIFNQPAPVVEPFDDSTLREEIRIQDSIGSYWKQESLLWQTLAVKLESKNDSLEKLKPSIINYYNEKYIFNANADINQLDSVIRANW